MGLQIEITAIGPGLDTHQPVIEIMCDATGKGTDCFYFLRLYESLFKSFSFSEEVINLIFNHFYRLR